MIFCFETLFGYYHTEIVLDILMKIWILFCAPNTITITKGLNFPIVINFLFDPFPLAPPLDFYRIIQSVTLYTDQRKVVT